MIFFKASEYCKSQSDWLELVTLEAQSEGILPELAKRVASVLSAISLCGESVGWIELSSLNFLFLPSHRSL